MSKYETAPYETIMTEGRFEVRDYPELVLAVVHGREISDIEGFREIFNYISGDNRSGEQIAMTTPVINVEGQMGFVMPRARQIGDLPAPESDKVRLEKTNPSRVVSIRFSGRATQRRLRTVERQLREWMAEKGYTPEGVPRLLRYDPPFMPPLLRRNELHLTVRSELG